MVRLPPWLVSLRRRLGPVTFATMATCLALQLFFGIAINLAHAQPVWPVSAEATVLFVGQAMHEKLLPAAGW